MPYRIWFLIFAFCVAADVSSEEVLEIIFERTFPPETLARYEMSGSLSYPGKLTDEALRAEIARIKTSCESDRETVSVELCRDAKKELLFRSRYLGKDLVQEARVKAWEVDAKARLACAANTENFILEHSFYQLDRTVYDGSEFGRISDNYHHKTQRNHASASISEFNPAKRSLHEFERMFVREDAKLSKTAYGLVVETTDKWNKTSAGGALQAIYWISGESIIVRLGAVGTSPRELLTLYGGKFKSTLPETFTIDKGKWGQDEFEFWLTKLKSALAENDELKFKKLVTRLRSGAYIPPLERNNGMLNLTSKQQFEKTLAWWLERKPQTYWHETMQMLVAKGESPDELDKADIDSVKNAIEARLKAPLGKTEEQLLGELAAKFNSDMNAREELEDRHFFISFNIREEGGWIWNWRQAIDGTIHKTIIRTPVITRSSDENYPFAGTLNGTFTEDGKEERVRFEYVYDKLQSRWRRK